MRVKWKTDTRLAVWLEWRYNSTELWSRQNQNKGVIWQSPFYAWNSCFLCGIYLFIFKGKGFSMMRFWFKPFIAFAKHIYLLYRFVPSTTAVAISLCCTCSLEEVYNIMLLHLLILSGQAVSVARRQDMHLLFLFCLLPVLVQCQYDEYEDDPNAIDGLPGGAAALLDGAYNDGFNCDQQDGGYGYYADINNACKVRNEPKLHQHIYFYTSLYFQIFYLC